MKAVDREDERPPDHAMHDKPMAAGRNVRHPIVVSFEVQSAGRYGSFQVLKRSESASGGPSDYVETVGSIPLQLLNQAVFPFQIGLHRHLGIVCSLIGPFVTVTRLAQGSSHTLLQ